MEQNFDFFQLWNQRLNVQEEPSSSTQQISNDPPAVWVFGYGSLCWYPGFEYTKCITGYIRGYTRKFWQGNTTHRGTPGKVRILVF